MTFKRELNRPSTGFSLLEVLIAVMILAIGLLGTAGLVLQSMKSNQSSYQRTQASILAYDLAERMRLNPALAVSSDNYVVTSTASPGAAPTCTTCSATDTAARDMYEWSTAANSEGLDGSVTRNGSEYTITMSWSASMSSADSGCGSETCSFALRVNL
jgi:type IV pilus assembly protein PilV